MWIGWSSLFIAIWLIISGLIANLQGPANLVICGILSILIGFFFMLGWEGVVTGVLGIWLILSGLVSGLIHTSNLLIIGISIAAVSLIRIYHQHSEGERIHKTA